MYFYQAWNQYLNFQGLNQEQGLKIQDQEQDWELEVKDQDRDTKIQDQHKGFENGLEIFQDQHLCLPTPSLTSTNNFMK